MTPAEKILWEELPPSGTFGGRISWESTFGGSKLFRDSLSIFTATPSAFGTSPKYDKLESAYGFKIYIVGFGGGGWGSEVDGDIHDLQKEEDDPLRPHLHCNARTKSPKRSGAGVRCKCRTPATRSARRPPNSTNLEFGGRWVGAE